MKVWGLAGSGIGFTQMPRVSRQPRFIDRVKLGSAWKFVGAGSATAISACKTQYFGNPLAEIIAFMFESVRWPEHPCPKHKFVHVRM